MLTKETIQHIKATHKAPKTFDDFINYIFLIIPLMALPAGFTVFNSYLKNNGGLSLLSISLFILSLGIFLTFFIFKRIKENMAFEIVEKTKELNVETLATVMKDNFKLSDIEVSNNLGCVIAYTRLSAFSWGEKITLILDNNTVLINSRPGGIMQPVTIFEDRSNIKIIKNLLLKNFSS